MEAFDRASKFIIFDVATQLPGRQGIRNFGHVTIENGVYLLPTWCTDPVSNVKLNQLQTTFPTVYNMTYFGEEEKKNRPYDVIDDVTEKRLDKIFYFFWNFKAHAF